MERPEMWHVFADSKGERSCSYGLSESLALNEQGEVIQFCKGKTEIPLEMMAMTEKEEKAVLVMRKILDEIMNLNFR